MMGKAIVSFTKCFHSNEWKNGNKKNTFLRFEFLPHSVWYEYNHGLLLFDEFFKTKLWKFTDFQAEIYIIIMEIVGELIHELRLTDTNE